MDQQRLLKHFSQDEIDAITVEAKNNGKDPDAVWRGRIGVAERRGKQPGQPLPEADAGDLKPRTVQTSAQAQAGTAAPQMRDKVDDASVKAAKEQEADIARVNTSRSVVGRASRASDIKEARPTRGKDRVPMHMRNIMTTEQRAGFARRWFNDTEHRVAAALDAGWDFVHKDGHTTVGDASGTQEGGDIGSRVSRPVGGGIVAYLMEIPEELHAEDQLAKQRMVNATEADMLPDPAKGEHRESFYTKNPGGSPVKIDRE